MNGVSVIVSAFNASDTIHEMFESLLAQTYQSWEAIVIDDGSTDDTAQKVREFGKRDSRIRLIQQKHARQSVARNAGIAEARYDWLLFLDADDWISPDHLKKTTDAASDPQIDAVISGSARVAADGTQVVERYLPPSGDLFRVLARRAAFPNHACIVRKSSIEAAGKFDPSFEKSEDWDLWQRVARTGAQFSVISDVLAFYRMKEGSASLQAELLLRDGLRVLRQGQGPDPRVANPLPEHANGFSGDGAVAQEFYLLSWCAGLLIGSGKDARPLLQQVSNGGAVDLYPDAIARIIFEAAPLPKSKSPQDWERLAFDVLSSAEEFLLALEQKSGSSNLSRDAGIQLKRMILSHSPRWKSVIEDYEQQSRNQKDDLAGRDHQIELYKNDLSERDHQIELYKNDLSERDHAIEGIRKDVSSRDQRINALTEDVSQRDHRIDLLRTDLEQRDQNIEALKSDLAGRLQTISILESEKENLTSTLKERDEKIESQNSQIVELERTGESWKIVAQEKSWILKHLNRRLWMRMGIALGFLEVPDPKIAPERTIADVLKSGMKRTEFLVLLIALIISAISQGLIFLLDGLYSEINLAGIIIAVLTASMAVLLLVKRRIRILSALILLYLIQIGVLAYKLSGENLLNVPRLFQVAVVILAAAIILSVVLSVFRVSSPYKAILLTFSIGIVLFFFETSQNLNPTAPIQGVEWQGMLSAHPTLQTIYPPHSVLKGYYADNPRGYFKVEDPREKKWWLRLDKGAVAELIFPPDAADSLKVEIKSAPSAAAYDIQLNMNHLNVKAGKSYRLQYRARSDQPRKIYAGFARAHDPWDNLGLYAQIDLKREWQTFQHEFRSTADDYDARVLFDLGEKNISVEFNSVILEDVASKTNLGPTVTPNKFLISYRFNAKGCRGADYEIPKPPGTYRILLLGRAFTLGVGVYEADTIASQLQKLLNDKSKNQGSTFQSFEVINCGTNINVKNRDALFYSLFAADYNADLVIEIVTPVFQQVQLGSTTAQMVSNKPSPPSPHLTPSAEEILQLDSEIVKNGGKLVVALLRTDADYAGSTNYGRTWNSLIKKVTDQIHQGSNGIPVLVLGKKAYEKNDYEDLLVYPHVDEHPNEIVDREVANEFLDYLKMPGVLKPKS